VPGTTHPRTGAIKAIKLMSIAGAYWKGDMKKINNSPVFMVRNISQSKELDEYLALLEESQKTGPS